jgi:hemerythrin superfamily protein
MDTIFSRRTLSMGAVGLAAMAAMRASVVEAQEAGGTWFDMVKRHHAMIAATLDKILATSDGQSEDRTRLQKHLGYLLTAHSVAEENVLYPALAQLGMTAASDRLYIEQAHAKVGNFDLEMSPKGGPDWLAKVSSLKTAILHHAKDEEEADLFPKLMQAAGPAMNAKLTSDYAKQFDSVRSV